jgi:hypothetical protein
VPRGLERIRRLGLVVWERGLEAEGAALHRRHLLAHCRRRLRERPGVHDRADRGVDVARLDRGLLRFPRCGQSRGRIEPDGRRADEHEARNPRGVDGRHAQGDRAAERVPHQDSAFDAEPVQRQRHLRPGCRPAGDRRRLAEAGQIRGDDAKARPGQGAQVLGPHAAIDDPRMQEHDRRPSTRLVVRKAHRNDHPSARRRDSGSWLTTRS